MLTEVETALAKLARLKAEVSAILAPVFTINQTLVDAINEADHEYRLARQDARGKVIPVLLAETSVSVPMIDRLEKSSATDLLALRQQIRVRAREVRQRCHPDHKSTDGVSEAERSYLWDLANRAIVECDPDLIIYVCARSGVENLSVEELRACRDRINIRIEMFMASYVASLARTLRSQGASLETISARMEVVMKEHLQRLKYAALQTRIQVTS